MASRASILIWAIALLTVSAAWAGDTDSGADTVDGALGDWMNIPTFAVEAALGTGVDDEGELVGESSSFPANVGVVHCRVALIDADQPQAVTVVWYREDEERSRRELRLSKETSTAAASLKIPAAQAGSWRVEIVDERDQLLTVLPFVVGTPTADNAPPRKKKKQP